VGRETAAGRWKGRGRRRHGKVLEADNVRRLQERCGAIAHGDFAAAVAAMTGDVEMQIFGPADFDFVRHPRGPEHGLAAMQTNFAQMEDQLSELLLVFLLGSRSSTSTSTSTSTSRGRAGGLFCAGRSGDWGCTLPVMLPTDEFDLLIGTASRAIDLAAANGLADGYALLRAGLARALGCESAGKPFGGELVARWCWVCEWYSGRYGVTPAPADPGSRAFGQGVHVAAIPTGKP
jgi:hypothetical protein